MDAESFVALIQELELRAKADPRGYQAHVLDLAVLGYAYLIGVVVLLVAMTIFLTVTLKGLSFKLVLPLVIVIYAVLRALWVRVPAPTGIRLQAADAPKLFALVQSLADRLHAPRVDTILIVPELNAAVVQHPRLGIFGWYHNYLLIGLPLLQAMSDAEWQSVLAHELGHLSGRHGWFGAWIYRSRETWAQLIQSLEAKQSSVGKFFFGSFLRWYAPTYSAHTFVLARAHEYEADAASAEIVGAATARRALLRRVTASALAEGFWNSIGSRAEAEPEPPQNVYQRLRLALLGSPGPGSDTIGEAWSRKAGYDDTHPALSDRLKALGWTAEDGEPPRAPEPLGEPSAANVYLGPVEERLASEYDAKWTGSISEQWKARHSTTKAARERLRALDDRPEDSLGEDEEWERIAACLTLDDEDRAARLCDALLERHPAHAAANFRMGQLLLRRGDAGGVARIEAAMRGDPEAIVAGCILLVQFHESRGDEERVKHYRTIGLERQQLLQDAGRERKFMTKHTQLAPHDWPPEQVAALSDQLARYPDLGEAYFARRVVRYLPEQPCFVLCIVLRTAWWQPYDAKRATALARRIATEVTSPVPYQVFCLTRALKPVRKALMRIPGARVA
jgi:Zn-dependent protease with chaperone function